MEDSERIEEDESKWQIECSLWKTRSTLFLEPVKTRRIVRSREYWSKIKICVNFRNCARRIKGSRAIENKDVFEDQCYDLSEEEQMTKAQKVIQKKADKEKRYQRVEILHSLGYFTAQIAEDSQVKMSKDTIKRWKSKIRQEGSIWRSKGSDRPKKLNNEHHLFILNLLHSSPFNTSKRIVYKLQNKFGLKVDRSTVSRFLVERGFKCKGSQVVFRNNEVDQKSRLEFCKENKER